MGASQPLRHPTGERAILPEEDGGVRQRARLDLCCSSPGWGCRPTPPRVALVRTVSSGRGGSMFPTDVIAQERIADRLRESEGWTSPGAGLYLNCSKCELVHRVSGLGNTPGHWAHREPAPHSEPAILPSPCLRSIDGCGRSEACLRLKWLDQAFGTLLDLGVGLRSKGVEHRERTRDGPRRTICRCHICAMTFALQEDPSKHVGEADASSNEGRAA